MGKGRNKRRRNQKKQRAMAKEPKDKKKKRQKPKYRSPKRKKRKEMFSPEPIRLGITAAFLADKGNKKFIATLRSWLDRGILTDLVFIAFGKWNLKTKSRFKSIIDGNGFNWAWNHLVFKMPREFESGYLLRCMTSYELNHYVDSERSHLAHLVLTNHYKNTTKIFHWDITKDSVEEFKDWLKENNGSYTLLHEPGENADMIISAGKTPYDFDLYGAT